MAVVNILISDMYRLALALQGLEFYAKPFYGAIHRIFPGF